MNHAELETGNRSLIGQQEILKKYLSGPGSSKQAPPRHARVKYTILRSLVGKIPLGPIPATWPGEVDNETLAEPRRPTTGVEIHLP